MQNGFILLDKPSGITSRAAAGRVARIFGTKKFCEAAREIKSPDARKTDEAVYNNTARRSDAAGDDFSRARRAKFGHVGTLDPMASGLLIVALGEATKVIPYLPDGKKEYLFAIQWGAETDTGDVTGNVTKEGGRIPAHDEIAAALLKLVGEYDQMPPAFSAKKIGGVPAYKLARKGGAVELSPKKVTIYELTQTADTFRVACSAGTYVRSIVADLAKTLGTIATCSMIRRTKSNGFDIKDAVGLDFLENLYNNGGAAEYLLPLDLGLDDIPVAGLETKDAGVFRNGGFVPLPLGDGPVRVYSGAEFIGIGNMETGVLKPKRIINVDK